jgi:20S proteasome subunit alpha 6
MFRNQYDTDCITWSPQGRIHQIEYAEEAVKQGSCCVGLVSNTHAIIATLKRSNSELGSHQQKVFKIDDHIGIGIAGLTPDGRVLSRYMRSECLNHQFVYGGPLPVGRLVNQVADKAQIGTQRSGKRPYGVGLLVVGMDEGKPRLFNAAPTGLYDEYKAHAIGARSQAARTYLERSYEQFPEASFDELVLHGTKALRESAADHEVTCKTLSFCVVDGEGNYRQFDDEACQPYVDMLNASEDAPASAPEAMETE